MHADTDRFHKPVDVFHAFFAGVLFVMLPAAGFEEQAGPQIGQGLVEHLFAAIQCDASLGYFAAPLEGAPVFVPVKS